MDEMTEVTEFIQGAAGSTADLIWGYCTDESLGEKIRITVIATGFAQNEITATLEQVVPEKKVTSLNSELPTMITAPITNPVQGSIPAMKAPESAPAEPYIKQVESPVKEQARIQFEPEPVVAPRVVPAPPMEAKAPEKVVHNLLETEVPAKETAHYEPEPHASAAPMPEPAPQASPQAVNHSRVEERLAHMREVNMRLRTPNGLAEMEREPAYKRRNVELMDGPRSTDSNVSRYTLTETNNENGERQVELRRNNPFLHDNVD
jgi:cell division protein FtsZ